MSRLILLLLLVAGGSGRLSGQDEPIRVDTNLVNVPFSVLDRNGRYVSNLKKQDVKLFEDGAEQEISYLSETDTPITALMLLDCSWSMLNKLDELAKAATSFIHQLKPNDQLIIVAFGEDVKEIGPQVRLAEFDKTIKLQLMGGGHTKVYDSVEFASRRLEKVPGRKAIILFTDGITGGDSISMAKSLRNVEEREALIYTVRFGEFRNEKPSGYVGMPVFSDKQLAKIEADINRQIEQYMSGLAQASGGRAFRIEQINDLEKTFGEISAELSRQYTLGYYSNKPGKDGERRRIKVQVNVPDVAVRSRNEVVYKRPKN